MKIYENTKFQEYTRHKNHRNVIFSEKKRLRQCITHTQGIKIPGTSFFQKKKRLRQCITHTQGIFSGFCMILHVFYVIEYEKILKIV